MYVCMLGYYNPHVSLFGVYYKCPENYTSENGATACYLITTRNERNTNEKSLDISSSHHHLNNAADRDLESTTDIDKQREKEYRFHNQFEKSQQWYSTSASSTGQYVYAVAYGNNSSRIEADLTRIWAEPYFWVAHARFYSIFPKT